MPFLHSPKELLLRGNCLFFVPRLVSLGFPNFMVLDISFSPLPSSCLDDSLGLKCIVLTYHACTSSLLDRLIYVAT